MGCDSMLACICVNCRTHKLSAVEGVLSIFLVFWIGAVATAPYAGGVEGRCFVRTQHMSIPPPPDSISNTTDLALECQNTMR